MITSRVNTFGHVRKEIKNLNKDLAAFRAAPNRQGPVHAELKTVDHLNELRGREEIMWRQRSQVDWLSAGDKNTHFFHQRASRRKKKKNISKLARLDGSLTECPTELGQLTNQFYGNLFSSEGVHNMEEVLDVVPRKVTDNMNVHLTALFSAQEVKTALFQMFDTKAPGPDGFPAHFFQRHWDICGEEVTLAVLRVLDGHDDPACINKTFIVLIPKVASPTELGQFRPISLCNVIYKISSKVLANRLKIVFSAIISEERSAFVPGRLITDNIIAAYECLHFMKRNKALKHRTCALKLDMKKAYDRVEWCYLKEMMLKLGFHRRWVDMVMRLVSSVFFSVLLNGSPLQEFHPSRGIRHGDPISPYLFFIAAEGLSCLLKSSRSSDLNGIKVAHSAPDVNHLLFTNDGLLFIKASSEGAADAKLLLDRYCDASGQQVNMSKSSGFFQ